MKYNKDNIFYKIINKEVKSNVIAEGEHYIAIHDVSPKAPVHILVITKGEYIDWYDFVTHASPNEIIDFNKGIVKVIDVMNLNKNGYKLITNSGKFGGQEVFHTHVHIMGNLSRDH